MTIVSAVVPPARGPATSPEAVDPEPALTELTPFAALRPVAAVARAASIEGAAWPPLRPVDAVESSSDPVTALALFFLPAPAASAAAVNVDIPAPALRPDAVRADATKSSVGAPLPTPPVVVDVEAAVEDALP